MLTSVVGFAALIVKAESGAEGHQGEQVLTHARRIQRSGARMNRLIGDLLDVASIEAGALAVKRQLADPSHVVTEAVDTFQTQAAASGVSLVSDVTAVSAAVEFDAARILQVLANLVGNAIKFTPSGGRVAVHLEAADQEVRFAVRDTGVGIPPNTWTRSSSASVRSITAIAAAWGWGSTSRNASCRDTAAASGPRAARAREARSGSRCRSRSRTQRSSSELVACGDLELAG